LTVLGVVDKVQRLKRQKLLQQGVCQLWGFVFTQAEVQKLPCDDVGIFQRETPPFVFGVLYANAKISNWQAACFIWGGIDLAKEELRPESL
jgi:hypothetical protein